MIKGEGKQEYTSKVHSYAAIYNRYTQYTAINSTRLYTTDIVHSYTWYMALYNRYTQYTGIYSTQFYSRLI